MKRFFTFTLAAALFGLSFGIYAADKNEQLLKVMQQKFPGSNISSVSEVPGIPGLVEIVAGKNIIYSSLDGKTIVVGHLYDTQTNRDITQAKLVKLASVNWKDLNLKNAIKRTSGSPEHEFAVFSDLNCGYCKKLDTELNHVSNYKANIFLVSMEFLQNRPVPAQKKQLINGIMCSANPGKAYHKYMTKGIVTAPAKGCDMMEKVKQNTLFFVKAGLVGTPNLIAKNGKLNAGYLPAPALQKWLKINGK